MQKNVVGLAFRLPYDAVKNLNTNIYIRKMWDLLFFQKVDKL